MTVVETRVSVWEALAGRAPGVPTGPADPGLWHAVVERLNPARARPVLRQGIEDAHLVSARAVPYVMLRSPDKGEARYLRLTPEEWKLALLCDGSRTVARLVAEFAKISGKLAPDQVTRVIADLAANRMLEELPVDVFRPIQHTHRKPWPVRLGRGMVAFAQGRRMVLASIDPFVGALYKGGGRLLFTRAGAIAAALIALAGIGLFCYTWAGGAQSVFLTEDSYVVGALVLLGLNVVALACHELGHALATKHAGRKVPVAGFLVYFGIPSVFVDTTDVWMSGRKGRIITTAAGPAAGLVLAGLAQIVAIVYPPAAPWAFKLCFAWYLNALFNLNPFLALDGYYLLMDWLEVPNLRARGLAWVIARVRRRPPRFAQLDREGRLVALYGMLAVVWLVIAGNLAYRIYTDRVAGLITGLWRSGWPARVLLLAVVAGLLSPVCYALGGWSIRTIRRVRGAWRERRRATDAPRRLAALRESALGRLPGLEVLAEHARWVHPRTGQHLVFAGAAQPDVFVVVDGAVEGRRPNDPSGLVRERVGPGGVVGLAAAVTGAPAALTWITAGTTLLAVPAPVVAGAVGPVAGPPPAERAELDALLAESPALAALTESDRLGMTARSKPATWAPGAPLTTAEPTDAVVVAAGVVTLDDGTALGRGDLIGPRGEGQPAAQATARTPVRTWTLPAVGGNTLLLGADGPPSTAGATAPTSGAHPPAAYPPLAAPPGAPPPVDEDTDRRFERKLWWLLLLLLVFALGVTTSNLWPGPAWAEMPTDRAMLTGLRGTTVAVVDGTEVRLGEGDEVYVSAGDTVTVAQRSGAWLTFRGGSRTVLCAGSAAGIGDLVSTGTGPVRPAAALRLDRGRVLVDTGASSGAFAPLALALGTPAGPVANTGDARWITEPQATVASTGAVRLDGDLLPTTRASLDCGDGVALPAANTAAPTSDPPATSASPVPSLTPAPSSSTTTQAAPDPTRGPTRGPTTRRPNNPPQNPPATQPPTTTQPPPTTSPPPPPDRTPPSVSGETGGTIGDPQCWEGSTTARVFASASDSGSGIKSVVARYRFAISGRSGQVTLSGKGGSYSGSIGPFSGSGSDRINVTVVATDGAGNTASAGAGTVSYVGCSSPDSSPTIG